MKTEEVACLPVHFRVRRQRADFVQFVQQYDRLLKPQISSSRSFPSRHENCAEISSKSALKFLRTWQDAIRSEEGER